MIINRVFGTLGALSKINEIVKNMRHLVIHILAYHAISWIKCRFSADLSKERKRICLVFLLCIWLSEKVVVYVDSDT